MNRLVLWGVVVGRERKGDQTTHHHWVTAGSLFWEGKGRRLPIVSASNFDPSLHLQRWFGYLSHYEAICNIYLPLHCSLKIRIFPFSDWQICTALDNLHFLWTKPT